MTAVVVTHTVGNIDTWLKGGAERKDVFAKFCSSYRIFRHPDEANRVSIVCENVDFAKLKATMDAAEPMHPGPDWSPPVGATFF